MSLKDSPYVPGIKELLRTLDYTNLHGLAQTATNNKLIPTSEKEAVEVILRYTENLAKLFSYRRMTSQVLFDYLHKKKAAVRAGETKPELIERIKKEWEKYVVKTKIVQPRKTGVTQDVVSRVPAMPTSSFHLGATNTTPSTPRVDTILNLNLTSPGVQINMQVTHGGASGGGVRSDVFVQEFCKWFYTMLNRLQPQGVGLMGDTFSPDVFMANCSMEMYLYGPHNAEKHASGQNDVYLLLKGVCSSYRLCFVPHLDTGTQAQMSKHGLLRLFCCGILHEGDSMAGVFEQEFGLVKCPQGRWKIMMTKINLKQTHSTACLPSLPKGTIFDVPA